MCVVSIQPCKTGLFTFPRFISYARCDWLFIYKRVLWRHEHDFAQSIEEREGSERDRERPRTSENQAIHGALDPWNPYIKIEILIYCPYTFSIEVVGIFAEVSIRLIFPDHVLNSHDNSVFQSIDVTRRNFMLITPGGVVGGVLRISSDRDVPMGPKINTPKNPLGFK